LHLGRSLVKGAEIQFDRPAWADFFPADILTQEFFRLGCAPHAVNVIQKLQSALNEILNELDKDRFDLYLVLGDNVTWPDDSSFEFARDFLWGLESVSDSYMGTKNECQCLQIPTEKLILIPGNHDKMLRRDLQLYHKFLRQHPNEKECYFVSKRVREQEFLFVTVDVSRYTLMPELTVDLSADCLGCLAAGEIKPDLIATIEAKLAALRKGAEVDQASLENYEAATKILVTHYALIDSLLTRMTPMEWLIPGGCIGSELLAEIGHHFDFAIHGHRHKPKLYRFPNTNRNDKFARALPVISVGTATQRTSGFKREDDTKGFYVISFLESSEIHAQHYHWSATANNFIKDPARKRSGTLNPSSVRKIS